MKYLLVSIGDIHIDQIDTIGASKIDRLCDLIISQCKDVDFLIFVVNGDIVKEGFEDQYYFALNFFTAIHQAVTNSQTNLDISYIFSPGNHDCDISNSSDTNKKSELKARLSEPEILNEYLETLKLENKQTEFFNFCELYRNPYLIDQKKYRDLFRVFDYNYENGKIRFITVNSSLYFNIDTNQGDIYIDTDAINMNVFDEDNVLKILLSHYPIEWYNRRNAEKLEGFLSKYDICIAGHEHYGEVFLKSSNQRTQIVIKNPVFNSYEQSADTGIYLISINTKELQVDAQMYIYNGVIFDIINEKNLTYKFSQNKYNNELASLSNEMSNKLNTIDGIITGSRHVSIDTLFINLPLKFANLEEKSFAEDEQGQNDFEYVSSNEIVFSSNSAYGFYGKMESGKTTLLRHYFFDFFNSNYLPVFLEGNELNRRLDTKIITQILFDRYQKQYSSSLEVFKQNSSKIVVLIDNIHEIQDFDIKVFLISTLISLYHTVVFSSSLSYQSTDLKQFSEISIFQYEILDLGQTEIYNLCENWMKLNGDFDKPNYHSKLINIKGKINVVSKKKIVPLKPLFVLMLLKANDENYSGDLENSHKRVYYEYLISSLIMDLSEFVRLSKDDIHVHFIELAYYAYNNPEPNFSDFISYMKDKYSFDDEYQFIMRELKNELIKRKVLVFEKMIYQFQYQFMYYTFLAQYITENIDDMPVDFEALFNNILDEKNANILLFLSQYYAKKSIISKVIEKADSLLEDLKEINFDLKDLEIYNHFISGVKNVERYGNVKDNNKKLLKLIDSTNRKEIEKQEKDPEEVISKLNKKQKQMIEAAKILLIINELLYSRNTTEITETLLNCAISLERRVQSFFTFEYIQTISEIAKGIEKGTIKENLEEELDFVKNMTSMFINIVYFSATNLGNIKNFPLLETLNITDKNYYDIMIFLFRLKNENEDEKISIPEVKKLINKFDKDNNLLLKGLVFSIIDYELNYVGLSPRKISELSSILNLSQKEYKRLLAKSTSS